MRRRIRKNKKTVAQLAQQQRFALAVSFLSPLKEIIIEGFKFVAKRKKRMIYPFNLAMSQVLKMAITDPFGVPTIDPEKAWLSDGNLPGVLVTDITSANARLDVDYVSNSTFGCWDDRIKLIVYQMQEGVALRSQIQALRRDGTVRIEIPENLLEKEILLYLLCHDRDGLRYARSQYLGTYTIK